MDWMAMVVMTPNDSAQRPGPRDSVNCNQSAMAGFAAAHGLGVSGSFGFRWLGILLLRLHFPEFVAIRSGFKALHLFVTAISRGQGQSPVLNLEDGSDNFADAISL